MKGKKRGKRYPVSLLDPESITDPEKARKLMEEVDKVVRPGIIQLQSQCCPKQGKNKSKQR